MARFVALGFSLFIPIVEASAYGEEMPLPPPPVVISTPRTEVWAALTTAEGIVAMEGGQAIVDLRPGGTIRRHLDAKAKADASGWTARPVLAFVAPRILLLGDDTPATWVSIELDALDDFQTRLRIEHTGPAAGANSADALEAMDRALVAHLQKRFPPKPDPVLTALTPMLGRWEERSETGSDVRALWTIDLDPGHEQGRAKQPSVSLERKTAGGESVDRWVFWCDPESGRWIGGLVAGGHLAVWEIVPYASGGIEWSDRWGDLGSRTISIELPPRDGAADVETIEGCIGEGSRWTRVPDRK